MNVQFITEMSMTIQRRVKWLAEEHEHHLQANNKLLAQQCLGGVAALYAICQDLGIEGAALYAGTELNRCRTAVPFQTDILACGREVARVQ